MRREISLGFVSIAALLLGTRGWAQPAPASGPLGAAATSRPIVTRQKLFSIPFYLNPQARSPQEVVLYVSGDRARSWSLYQRRRATDQKFDFQAGQDGEFWFAVRTDLEPPPSNDSGNPEKIVIVDTVQPELNVTVQPGPSGLLAGKWRVTDPNLDATTFRLQYQLPGEEQWRPVTVEPPSQEADAADYSAEVTWTVAEARGSVRVRAECLDRAGNTATYEDRIELQQVATPPDVLAGASSPPTSVAPAAVPVPALPWASDSAAATGTPQAGSDWRPGSSQALPEPLTANAGAGQATDLPPSAPAANYVFRSHGNGGEPAASPAPAQGIPTRPGGSESLFHSASVSSPPDTADLRLRADRQVPMTSSPRFNLDYELVDISKADVARVELWITEDEGRNWRVYGEDSDRESPVLVEVQREGVYGFRLLIQDQRGAAADPPRPGDQPDLWVGVDWTRPQAKLVSVRLVADVGAPLLEITWEAGDPYLTNSPVRLSYSETPQGPWNAMAPDLANTGAFRWRPESQLPDRIFVQMEVRDRAGNQMREQWADPIATRDMQPKGRIRRFEPVAP